MDVAHRVRLGEDEEVVVALQVVPEAAEAFAAEILLRELQPLDLRAHGTVEDEDALGRGGAQRPEDLGAVGGVSRRGGHAGSLSGSGGFPRRGAPGVRSDKKF